MRQCRRCILAALIVFLGSGQARPQGSDARATMLQAVKHNLAAKKYADALSQAGALVALDRAASDKAEAAWDRGRWRQAQHERASSLDLLAQVQKAAGKSDDHVHTLSEWARVCASIGQEGQAEKLCRRVVEIQEKEFGSPHPALARSLNALAVVLGQMDRRSEAQVLWSRAASLLEKQETPLLADVLLHLGKSYAIDERTSEGETSLLRAVRILEAKLGADHVDTALAYRDLGHFYRSQGHAGQAITWLRRAALVHAKAKAPPPSIEQACVARNPRFALGHANVVRLASEQLQAQTWASVPANQSPFKKDGKDTKVLLRTDSFFAVDGNPEGIGKDSSNSAELAVTLNLLGLAYLDMGDFFQAGPCLKRALDIREKVLSPEHPDLAVSLVNFAVFHLEGKNHYRFEWSRPLLERGLKILEKWHAGDHPDLAVPLLNLAFLAENQKETIAESAKRYQRALQILETKRGKNHPDVAECLERHALLLLSLDKHEEAEPMFKRSLAIREKFPGNHPALVRSLETQVRLLVHKQDWRAVAQLSDRINRLLRWNASVNLPTLTPAQQLSFIQRKFELALHRSLSLPYYRRDDKELIALSAEWILNGKAIAHHAKAQQAVLLRDSRHPQAPEIVKQLLAVRAELAVLALRPPSESDVPRRIERLEELQRDLASRLEQGQPRPAQSDLWTRLKDVRDQIPKDAVLIEIVDFDLWDFKKHNWKSVPWNDDELKKLTDFEKAQSRYVAWVIPPEGQGDVRMVDLGDMWVLRDAVQSYQTAMKAALRNIQIDEKDAEDELKKPLKVLSKLLLHPLRESLGNTKHWIISPDNHLWFVPWAALPLDDGSYAIERAKISYVVSGRDLLRPKGAEKPGPPLIVGDPDFDLAPGKAKEAAGKLWPRDRFMVRGPAAEATERIPRDWQRLLGTADEIKRIQPSLSAYAKGKPQVHSGARALESVVKAMERPVVLVLSTHGFVIPAPAQPALMAGGGPMIPARKIRLRFDDRDVAELHGDPLVRCGLVLAGANQREKKSEPGADDGLLTGLEVLGCDLRGTQLVVLSACETGLGDVSLGEGVAGLRQAFHLAGARSVVASSWKVSDQESARLMTLFWDNLAAGQGKGDALRNAQLEMIRQRREREKAAHPFFWAAFTMTGDWR